MELYIASESLSPKLHTATEPLFLNPDGTRKTFPIGWEGKGRYIPHSLKLYRTSTMEPIDPAIYHEESDRINFTFNTAPASGSYEDITVKYIIDPIDYVFSQGTSDSAYPGEEYFLFPNWNNAKGCGAGFWVGKYAASRADATTTTSQGTSNVPVSKKNKCSWVNTAWSTQVNSCTAKGNKFHCIRNREWVSIALWTETMGIAVKGNDFGYNTNGTNIDGEGTNITSSTVDLSANPPTTERPDGTYVKIRTGMGPNTFRHNGKSDGICDLAGNVIECVDGLQLRDGVPYILNDDNTAYIALSTNAISASTTNPTTINYINSSTDDLLNEGLPVDSAGLAITVSKDGFYQIRTGTKICYRGGNCGYGDAAGVWALSLHYESSSNGWGRGFRLVRSL